MNSRMEKPKTKDNDSKLFWPKKVLKILNFNADCFIRWRLRWCYHRHPLLRLTAVYTGQTHLQLVVQELPPKEALTLQGKISLRKPLAIKFNLDLCGLFWQIFLDTPSNHCTPGLGLAQGHSGGGSRPGTILGNSVSMPSVRSTTTSLLTPGTAVAETALVALQRRSPPAHHHVMQATEATQTERKLTCMQQFLYCLLANQVSSCNLHSI